MVYNELGAPFNQSNSKNSPKQKRLSLSHNGKNHCTNPKIASTPTNSQPNQKQEAKKQNLTQKLQKSYIANASKP
jgi:hypothetical protein